jgi:hypothetical protein
MINDGIRNVVIGDDKPGENKTPTFVGRLVIHICQTHNKRFKRTTRLKLAPKWVGNRTDIA